MVLILWKGELMTRGIIDHLSATYSSHIYFTFVMRLVTSSNLSPAPDTALKHLPLSLLTSLASNPMDAFNSHSICYLRST